MSIKENKGRRMSYINEYLPDSNIDIVDRPSEGVRANGFGGLSIQLLDKHIEALRKGKMLTWNDGEYSTYIVYGLDKERKKSNA